MKYVVSGVAFGALIFFPLVFQMGWASAFIAASISGFFVFYFHFCFRQQSDNQTPNSLPFK